MILLLSAALLTGGCRKKQVPPPETDTPRPVQEEASSRAIQMNRTGEQPEPEAPAEKDESTASRETSDFPEFSGPLFLQRKLPQSRLLPEGDFVGPFLDYFSSSENERLAGNLLQNFFFSFFSGIVNDRYLAGDLNRLFREELESYKSLGSEMRGFSAGSLELSGNRGSVRVRIFSDTGSIAGRIYLYSDGTRWFIEDWEIPFALWPGEPPAEEETGGN